MTVTVHNQTNQLAIQFREAPAIRLAAPEDAEALYRIYNHPNVLVNTSQPPISRVEDMQNWITAHGTPGKYMLVAHIGAQILGALCLKTDGDPVIRHLGEIYRVAVDQERSGWGVGSRLMAAALDLTDNWLNLYRVELMVRTDNLAAIRLYRRFGFEDEGIRRGYGFRGGQYMDCLMMARLRGPLLADR